MNRNSGVAVYNGRARAIERYRDRAVKNGNKSFPNRRRKITTGKELTTPLGRSSAAALDIKKRKYIAATKEQQKIRVRHRVVSVEKKGLPVGTILCLLVFFGFLLALICSYIVIHEKDVRINEYMGKIAAEERRERTLSRELDVKNDLNAIISYAVNELGMVKEDQLQRHYITSASDDKVIIPAERSSGAGINFTNLLSVLFN
jgi:hypothetical protein